MEDFGVRVATLQHVLEGYKVADEIARHGAGASCFSDWWSYKIEVIDAIPYNGALMHRAGVPGDVLHLLPECRKCSGHMTDEYLDLKDAGEDTSDWC